MASFIPSSIYRRPSIASSKNIIRTRAPSSGRPIQSTLSPLCGAGTKCWNQSTSNPQRMLEGTRRCHGETRLRDDHCATTPARRDVCVGRRKHCCSQPPRPICRPPDLWRRRDAGGSVDRRHHGFLGRQLWWHGHGSEAAKAWWAGSTSNISMRTAPSSIDGGRPPEA